MMRCISFCIQNIHLNHTFMFILLLLNKHFGIHQQLILIAIWQPIRLIVTIYKLLILAL